VPRLVAKDHSVEGFLSMRRYIVTCDFHPAHENYSAMAREIKLLDAHCEQPHRGAWLLFTNISAHDIRASLLPHVDFCDRFFVCETGEDTARFNALQRSGARNVINFEPRKRSAMLSSVLHDSKPGSRMLKAATAGNFRSA